MNKRLARAEVPVELTWDLSDLFPSIEAWETEMASIAADFPTVTQYRGKLADGARVLFDCLEAHEKLLARISRMGIYVFFLQSTDNTNPDYQGAMERASALRAQYLEASAFIQAEILSLPGGTLECYLQEESVLQDFRPMFEQLTGQKAHQLSAETEAALAAFSDVLAAPANIYRRSKFADMTFDPIEDGSGQTLPMSFALYERTYEKSPDQVLRRNAFQSFTKGLKSFQNTYGATWGAEVRKQVVVARLRGFPSAIEMILHEQEVPPYAYHNLLDIVFRELAPHMRRYARLRKRALGLDRLLYCDIEAPLDPEYQASVTFAEAAQVITAGLAVLGPEYAAIIDQALHNRWIDLADNVGKTTDAFGGATRGAHGYVLMTWTNSMRDTLTLSHELGHAVHSTLTTRNQRLLNCAVSRFFIEAPSTINEALVGNYIIAQSQDQRMRRWLTMQLLMSYHHNFVRHLIEGELQRRAYVLAEQGQPITASLLNRMQGEILQEFWGDEVAIDDGARLTWMRQIHYYMGLYSYTYVAGLTIGTAVARAIQEEGQPAVDRWLTVLKAGGSKPPVELAKMAGVDMTNPDAIRKAIAYVGSLVDEVEKSF